MDKSNEKQRIRINGKRWTCSPECAGAYLTRLGVLAHIAGHAVILAALGGSVRVHSAGNAVISVEGVRHA